MIYHRERLVHGHVSSEQIVQLFDDLPDMAAAAASFLDHGRRAGASLLVIARAPHCAALSGQLEARGCDVNQMQADGQLVVLDTTLTPVAATKAVEPRHATGEVQPLLSRFEAQVGDLVRDKTSRGEMRIYTEMVDVLAELGSYAAAEQVDRFWKRLAHECSVQILNGYASARFADRRREAVLENMLGPHPNIQSESSDLVAAWLLSERESRFHTD